MNLNESETIQLPLNSADLTEVIENGSDLSNKTVDIKQCLNALDESLLVYLSNLSINPQFDFSNCDYNDKLTIFKQWLELNSVYNQSIFVYTLMQLISLKSCKKYINLTEELFNKEQLNSILQNPYFDNIITDIVDFVCSSPLIFIDEYQDIGIDVVQLLNNQIKINSNSNISINSVLLFNLPEIFDVINNGKYCLTNFIKQYNMPIYNGTSIEYYIEKPDDFMNIYKNPNWINNNTYHN